ncbi:uncharacterized protein IL334_004368 [Kwoniella shivajii]|uniref:3'-5' exonuclease domain-containing protein n=1 Tax=Kwoniella shivajii TaxID=564305 RepID=A0ABZ1D1E2_9TREE|nr:hypothetical protein IL334_004368 [Kwoniella shivajii]
MSNSDGNQSGKNTKSLLDDLDLGIGIWEGKTVFTSEPTPFRSRGKPQTPRGVKVGSSTSPISISSSSPSPSISPSPVVFSSSPNLPRPRAVPQYTSPLPRAAYTSSQGGSQKPIHPFFNRARSVPTPSQPRYVAHYSSTEASTSSQPSVTESQSSELSFPPSSQQNQSQNQNQNQNHDQKLKRDKELDYLADEIEKMSFSKPKSRKPLVTPATIPVPNQIAKEPISYKRNASKPTATLPRPSNLPIFHYSQYTPAPQVAYTSSIEEANDLLSCLKGDVLGFDLEWPPGGRHRILQKDGSYVEKRIAMTWNETTRKYDIGQGRTALMQFCDEKLVVLVHLGEKMDIPSKAIEILRSPSIYKLGVQVRGDGQKLLRDFPDHFIPPRPSPPTTISPSNDIGLKGLFELSLLARAVDSIGTGPGGGLISLSNLSKWYLEKELDKDKDVRKGDWTGVLDQKQKDYAANDVYASLQIFNKLRSIAKENDFPLDLNKYLSVVESFGSLVKPVTNGTRPIGSKDAFGAHLQIGDKSVTLQGGVRPPTPAQLSALNDFVGGVTIASVAERKGIKLATAEGYICNALQILGADFLSKEQRRRLWDEVTRQTYTWKRNKELYKVLKEEFDPTASSGSESEEVVE